MYICFVEWDNTREHVHNTVTEEPNEFNIFDYESSLAIRFGVFVDAPALQHKQFIFIRNWGNNSFLRRNIEILLVGTSELRRKL